MRAGRLDRIITILRNSPTRTAGLGELVDNWQVYLAPLPASYTPARAGEKFVAAQLVNETEALFTIRWRSDIKATDRIRFEGRLFEILGDPLEIGRRDGLSINAKSIAEPDTGPDSCPTPPAGWA